MKYTILLGRPIQASECAYDTYMAVVEADTPKQAQRAARLAACADDNPGDGDDLYFPDEYEVLMVIEGEHENLADDSADEDDDG